MSVTGSFGHRTLDSALLIQAPKELPGKLA